VLKLILWQLSHYYCHLLWTKCHFSSMCCDISEWFAGRCWRKMQLAHCRRLLMMSFISQRDGGCWTGRSMSDLAWCVSLHRERVTVAQTWLFCFIWLYLCLTHAEVTLQRASKQTVQIVRAEWVIIRAAVEVNMKVIVGLNSAFFLLNSLCYRDHCGLLTQNVCSSDPWRVCL